MFIFIFGTFLNQIENTHLFNFKTNLFCNRKRYSNIIPIPKTGDLSEYSNYRGIMLSAVAAKITNRMILNRIQSEIDVHQIRTDSDQDVPPPPTL